MRKINKWLATLLAVLLVAGCLPLSALAEGEGTGMSADDPIIIPTEGLVINESTLYGIDETWFEDNDSDDGHLYVSFSIPSTITQIADNAFRDNFTGNKRKYGAVNTTDNKGKSFDTVAIDFSEATSLETIGSQASYQCAYLKGELNLSGATSLKVIEKSAFNGCTGLTGVILPDSLTALGSADSGSVFNSCTGLQYIRRASSSEDAVFELPETLTYIGKQAFKGCFPNRTDIMVKIPASVETIGSEALYCSEPIQVVFERESGFSGYDSRAFKGESNSNPTLLIFPSDTAYKECTTNYTRAAKTYPVKLEFEGGTTQDKLYKQSIQYEKDENTGFWKINEHYQLPDVPETSTIPGYDAGWKLYGDDKILTNTSDVDGWPDATLKVSVDNNSVVSEPTISYSVNGAVQSPNDEGNVEISLTGGEPGYAGFQVDHPLLKKTEEQDTYVYFKYVWWDVQNAQAGIRSTSGEEDDIFSCSPTNNYENRVFTDLNEIPIRNAEDERLYSSDFYEVEIFGYYVKDGGNPQLFYKSHGGVIGGNDPLPTTDKIYRLYVSVDEYNMTADTVTMDFGTAQEGYTPPKAQTVTLTNTGTQELTVTLPVSDNYSVSCEGSVDGTITIPVGGSVTISIQPKAGISVGEHEEVIEFTCGEKLSVTVTATFEVTSKPTPPPYIPPVDDDDDQPEDPDDTGVSDLLNTKDHDQYLFGYPDGTFGPGLNMTRAEAAQMFYNLLVDQDVEAPSVFDDVPEGAWYAEPVNVMAKLSIVEGVGDDKFEPNREITRAEFTAMAMRFAEGETGGKNIFSDVDEDDWFYDVVVDSIKYGWIEGYPDGTFRPQNLITREEVTTIVNRMLGRLPDEKFIDAHEDDLDLFPDVTKNWAYYDVVEATNDHQYKKTSSGEDWTKLG